MFIVYYYFHLQKNNNNNNNNNDRIIIINNNNYFISSSLIKNNNTHKTFFYNNNIIILLFFYNNFIHSYLSYGIHLYYSMTPKSQTKQLYDIQKKALRLVCKPYQRPKKTLSNAWITQKTHVLPVPLLSTYSACNFAFSIKSGRCPSYISEYFQTIGSNQTNRTRQTRYQHKLPSSYKYNQPNHYLVTSFNSLPPNLRSSSPSSFKAKLKHHLYSLVE